MSDILPLRPKTIHGAAGRAREAAHVDLSVIAEGLAACDLECEHIAAAQRVLRQTSAQTGLVVSPHLQLRADALFQERRRLARSARRLHDFIGAAVHGGGAIDATEAQAFGRLVTSLREGLTSLHEAELELLMHDHWTDIGLSGCG